MFLLVILRWQHSSDLLQMIAMASTQIFEDYQMNLKNLKFII